MVWCLYPPSLPELVKDGENGLVFSSSDELAEQLETLLKGFSETPKLNKMRENVMRRSSGALSKGEWCSWDENWDMVVRPLVLSDVDGNDIDWIQDSKE